MGEVPQVRLTGSVKAVLRVLHAAGGRKLAVAVIARDARLSASTVRTVLTDLGKAKLVQHVLLPSAGVHPPRLGYWLTGAGMDVASAQRVTT